MKKEFSSSMNLINHKKCALGKMRVHHKMADQTEKLSLHAVQAPPYTAAFSTQYKIVFTCALGFYPSTVYQVQFYFQVTYLCKTPLWSVTEKYGQRLNCFSSAPLVPSIP